MKKALFVGFLLTLLSIFVFGLTDAEMRQECRRVIYAVRPVEAVRALDDDSLVELMLFAGRSYTRRTENPEFLNRNDSILVTGLFSLENKRRSMTPDEFSLALQEEHERLMPYIQGSGGDVSAYIKIDNWIDLFRLNLMVDR
jgi:hypothetical protein